MSGKKDNDEVGVKTLQWREFHFSSLYYVLTSGDV